LAAVTWPPVHDEGKWFLPSNVHCNSEILRKFNVKQKAKIFCKNKKKKKKKNKRKQKTKKKNNNKKKKKNPKNKGEMPLPCLSFIPLKI